MDTNRFPLWSREEDARLSRMAAGGQTKQEVALALGRSVNAVASRAAAIRVRFRGNKAAAPAPALRRRCLRCRNFFDVPSRFRFVCDLCHTIEEWRGADLG